MKRSIVFGCFALVLAIGLFFAGCNDGSTNTDETSGLPQATETIPEGYLRVNYQGSGDLYLWAWKDVDESETKKCDEAGWEGGGIPFTHVNGDFTCVDIKLAAAPSIVGLIVKNKNGSKNYTGGDVLYYFPKKYNEIFFKANSGTIYVTDDFSKEPIGTSGASVTGSKTISLTCNGVVLGKDTVKLTDKDGKEVGIASYTEKELKLSESIKDSYAKISPLKLAVTDKEGNVDTLTVNLGSSLVESWYGTNALESVESNAVIPGLTLTGKNAAFTAWAPVASSVKLLLYKDAKDLSKPSIDPISMEMDENGFWTAKDVDVSTYKYYKYRITNSGVDHDVADIWHTVASGDSVASQIIAIDDPTLTAQWEGEYTNPWNGSDYSDAVIYEMHIRDWSRAFVKDSTGKFQDIAKNLGEGAFAKHLKDLGVTHVQILPMFDYAETNDDAKYNWGYNPYHYNVPEGRYVNYGTEQDGTYAVLQMREMIKAFHDAGIAVNMDVVYNHTSGTGNGSLYDMTIPEYFYRFDASGNYSNGSGCGNEVATNHAMVKKYVIDSLKHWMNDYHINGFRFDLMGVHEKETMKDIYDELYKIDPKVMVYGEPWTGGSAQVKNGAVQAVASGAAGAGAFDDDFRDAIKGAEFGGFQHGQVQGTFKDDEIIKGLTAQVGKNKRNETGKPGLALHYVECHDNYTLFDKLAMSYLDKTTFDGDLFAEIGDEGLSAVKAQNKLSAAYIFLSQGTPFINGGQEFLRTKRGDENSYSSSDTINQIDLSFKDTYNDVYNTYKGLIALRKANPQAFGANKEAKAEKLSDGVTKYTTDDFCVYFNATDKTVDITATGFTKAVDVSSGTPSESGTLPTQAAAKSFVILKK